MAEDQFHTGLCSTESWWNTLRSTATFGCPPPISCSTTMIGNGDSPSWSQPFLTPYYRQEEQINVDQTQMGFGDSSENLFVKCISSQPFLPNLFESEPSKDINELAQPPSWSKLDQQQHFSNNAAFWNPSFNLQPSQLAEPRFEIEPSCTNLNIMKPNCHGVQHVSTFAATKPSVTKKKGSEPTTKKPRIETPSPLPTFKVRKEKLGDRITALQQLVSPFGKTDTASVLQEAIEYIKFLHDQVGALSNPYFQNGPQMQYQKTFSERSINGEEEPTEDDLRSRGLCLAPISSTFAVASEPHMDYWTYPFGGYR